MNPFTFIVILDIWVLIFVVFKISPSYFLCVLVVSLIQVHDEV